ncbi:hypothetical protein R1sor_015343 [Riccia sorocarpa]|uniref:DDE Tnp4 domain-containing protein n=1 Tax=Riccia sorocarpa TaxID=122646 RepID=A0ABD3HFV4_9MARC
MDRNTFLALYSRLQNHPIFTNESHHSQTPPIVQLAVALDRLGHEGNGACIDRSMELWGVSHGTLVNFTCRVLIAIEDILSGQLQWPSPHERRQIFEAFAEKGFPGCVGLIDGTLVELLQRPAFDGETYYDRKANYSINVQVVCDHRRKITFLYSGLPGSVQDVTTARRSSLWKFLGRERSAVFGREEYLLGDSGYVPMAHLVPAFRLSGTDRDKADFNNCLAHARVVNEHCIGVLKSRWHSLKQIRTQLKCRAENQIVIKWVKCCAILHNFMICARDDWTSADGNVEYAAPPTQNPTDCGIRPSVTGAAFRNQDWSLFLPLFELVEMEQDCLQLAAQVEKM